MSMDGDRAREDFLFYFLKKNPIQPHPFNSLSREEQEKILADRRANNRHQEKTDVT